MLADDVDAKKGSPGYEVDRILTTVFVSVVGSAVLDTVVED